MNQISPKKFFIYAKKNLSKFKESLPREEKERILINTSGSITKGLHSQIDEVIKFINKILGKNFDPNMKFFDEKKKYIENTNFLTSPIERNALDSLNKQRVKLEHYYQVPSFAEVEIGLKNLKDFIDITSDYMKNSPKEIRENIDSSINKLKEFVKNKKEALKTYPIIILKFLNYCKKDPKYLESSDANFYVQKMIDDKFSPYVIQSTRSAIKSFYENILGRSWMENLKNRPPRSIRYPPRISRESIKKFIESLPSERDKIIAKIVDNKGLSPNEIINLDINDIEKLSLPNSILSDLKKYLRERKNGALFLTAYGKRITLKAIQIAFQKASEKSGIKLTCMMLRQTHPSVIYRRGTINSKVRKGSPRFALKEGEFLTKEEFEKLLIAFPVEKREIIYFIYHLGIPLKQFSGIKIEDIDFEGKKIRIKPTKFCKRNNAILENDVSKKLKKYLEKNKIHSGMIFKNDLSMYTKWIKNYGKIAGISKRLNHSVVSNSKFSEERYLPC